MTSTAVSRLLSSSLPVAWCRRCFVSYSSYSSLPSTSYSRVALLYRHRPAITDVANGSKEPNGRRLFASAAAAEQVQEQEQQLAKAPVAEVQTPLPPEAKLPTPDGEEKVFSAKITRLVEEIANLPLVEVADLNAALKKRLNLPDVSPMAAMPMMMAAVAGPSADDQAAEEAAAAAAPKKTTFAVKLTKFDEGKKIALIKEIKNVITGLNLVQAKKFVESLPQQVKDDLSKDEAEKLKETLTACGGTCEVV